MPHEFCRSPSGFDAPPADDAATLSHHAHVLHRQMAHALAGGGRCTRPCTLTDALGRSLPRRQRAVPPCPAWGMDTPRCWPPCMRSWTAWPMHTPASSPRQPAEELADLLVQDAPGRHQSCLLRVRRLRSGGSGAEDGTPVLRRDRPAAAPATSSRAGRATTATRWAHWPWAAMPGGARSSRRC